MEFRRWFAYYFDQNIVKFSVLDPIEDSRIDLRGQGRGQGTDPRTEDKAKDMAKESEARTRPHILSSRPSSNLEDEAVLKEHNTEQYAERTRLAHPSTTERKCQTNHDVLKIHNNLAHLLAQDYVTQVTQTIRNSHPHSYQVPYSRTEPHRQTFFPRTWQWGIGTPCQETPLQHHL